MDRKSSLSPEECDLFIQSGREMLRSIERTAPAEIRHHPSVAQYEDVAKSVLHSGCQNIGDALFILEGRVEELVYGRTSEYEASGYNEARGFDFSNLSVVDR